MKISIIDLARKISKQYTTGNRADGKTYKYLKQDEYYNDWMQDVIRAGHLDTLPNDESYEACETVIDAIAELDKDEIDNDEVLDNLDIDPSCYTSALTGWLHSNNSYIEYITEAIETYGDLKDGFQILTCAYTVWMEEVKAAIVDALIKVADSMDET